MKKTDLVPLKPQLMCLYCFNSCEDFNQHWLYSCLEIPDEVWDKLAKDEDDYLRT